MRASSRGPGLRELPGRAARAVVNCWKKSLRGDGGMREFAAAARLERIYLIAVRVSRLTLEKRGRNTLGWASDL